MIEICQDSIIDQCIIKVQQKTRYSNCYLTISELQKANDKSLLIAYQDDDVLLVLHRQEHYFALYFWCETWGWLAKLDTVKPYDEKLVIGIVQKSGQELSTFFERYHFTPYRMYNRLRKKGVSIDLLNKIDVSYCDEGDLIQLKEMMQSTFDPIGDNIPSDDELVDFLFNQAIICVRNDRGLIKGFIIFEDKGKTSYIRMVCVDKAYRGMGVGQQLMAMYFNIHSGFIGFTLWYAVDNKSAFGLYSRYGYEQESIYNYIYVL